MPWPLSQDYNESVQSPAQCLGDAELKQGEATVNGIGLPRAWSGNFADVYQLNCGQRKWAVKCFTRQVAGLRERYSEISAYLAQAKLPFMVEFKYLDQGVRVRGQWYPVLKMHWVEGHTLNEFVKQHADNPPILDLLSQIWLRMAKRLREANMAHADLQHGNVLLVPGSTAKSLAVKLIDYDGMFVPALAQKRSGEVGHAAYQHPQRLRDGTYTAEVDRFPNLVIYTALRALMVGSRYLWNKYDNGDNLLFKQADLEAPNESAVFQELLKLNDPEVRKLAQMLKEAARLPLGQVPLLEEVVPQAAQTAVATSAQPAAPAGRRLTARPIAAPAAAGAVSPAEPPLIRPRARAGSRSLWAALGIGGVAAAVLLAVGVFFATRDNHPPAQSTVGVTPPKQVEPPKIEPKVEPKPQPKIEPKPEPKVEPKPEPKAELKPEPKVLPRVEPKFEVKLDGKAAPTIREARRVDAADAPIRQIALGPLGRQAVTYGGSHELCVWDLENWRIIRRFGRTDGVAPKKVILSPLEDRALVHLAGRVDSIDLKTVTGRSLTGRDEETVDVALAADGRRMVLTGTQARVVDMEAKKQLSQSEPLPAEPFQVSLTPDGKRALLVGASRLLLWPIDLGPQLRAVAAGATGITGGIIAPDGRTALLTAGTSLLWWDLDRDQAIARFSQSAPFTCVAFSADGRRALAGSRDGTTWLLDLQEPPAVQRFEGNSQEVTAVAFLPSGRQAVTTSTDRSLRVWSLPESTPVVAKPEPKPEPKPLPKPQPAVGEVWRIELGQGIAGNREIVAVAVSPDGRHALCSNNSNLARWDLGSGKLIRVLPLNTDELRFAPDSLRFTPDGRRILYRGIKGALSLFDFETEKAMQFQDQPPSMICSALSPDGRRALLGAGRGRQDKQQLYEGCTAVLWSVETGQELRRFDGHREPVVIVGFSPDGRHALSGSADLVSLWDTETGREVRRLTGLPSGSPKRLSPDGRFLLFVSQDALGVWDLEAGREVRRFEKVSTFVRLPTWSPDGRYVMAATYNRVIGEKRLNFVDHHIRVWEIATGRELRRFEGHTAHISSLAFSPNGRQVLSGSQDGTMRLWELGLTESSSGKPPAKPAPVKPAPAKPAPVKPAPAKPAPAKPAPGVQANAIEPATLAGAGISKDWQVIFCSADPSIWNQDVNDGPSQRATPLSKVPIDIRFLRIRRDSDYVIVPMSKDRISKVTAVGKYGFEGTSHSGSGARHLGVYCTDMPCKANGDICVRILPWYQGWGFGHKHFVNTDQGYCWDGAAIAPVVFEIAVKRTALTNEETKKLLGAAP